LKERSNSRYHERSIYNKYLAELNKTTDVDTLSILYDNLPNYIKEKGYVDIERVSENSYKLQECFTLETPRNFCKL
jgi:hypothetical protein